METREVGRMMQDGTDAVRSLVGGLFRSVPALRSLLLKRLRHPTPGVFISAGALLILLGIVLFPPRGRVLPVGPGVVEAYELLQQSATGRQLLRDVHRSIGSSIIYVTLGDTERDELIGNWGLPVRGCTRALFRAMPGGKCRVARVAVITNREVTGDDPREIVKSLAYELENVKYIHHTVPCGCDGRDSPLAELIQSKVAAELAL